MKKLLIPLFGIILLTGCTKGETYTCEIDGEKAIFELKDGMISSYTLNSKKQSQSTVDDLNGTYFTSSTNNEEGKVTLKNYVESQNGTCNF